MIVAVAGIGMLLVGGVCWSIFKNYSYTNTIIFTELFSIDEQTCHIIKFKKEIFKDNFHILMKISYDDIQKFCVLDLSKTQEINKNIDDISITGNSDGITISSNDFIVLKLELIKITKTNYLNTI
jgi:hypothetical protein